MVSPQSPALSDAVAAAKALAAEAQTLDALEAAIAAFEGCPLRYEGARRAVFSRGRPDAEVMVIGEAPGADEDAQGRPFVGRAGQLLDRMLAAAGLSERVFITNTVFWRPPGNRQPSPLEQTVCEPFLERAIFLVRPKVLLLLGGASAKSVLKCSGRNPDSSRKMARTPLRRLRINPSSSTNSAPGISLETAAGEKESLVRPSVADRQA